MNHFCTLFNRTYLAMGVSLIRSLRQNAEPCSIHVLCMDDATHTVLGRLGDSNVKLYRRQSVESLEYQKLEEHFSPTQKFWIAQPLFVDYLLRVAELPHVTYVEADSYFFSNPKPIFDEMKGASVTLAPHRYSPGFDQTERSGLYCTHFNVFMNNPIGLKVIDYWRENCFKYDRTRSRYFPGQLCLDQWEKKFDGTHVIRHLGAGLAPWNVQQYDYQISNGILHVNGDPLIFYHFHELVQYNDGDYDFGYYPIPKVIKKHVYEPYLKELAISKAFIREQNPNLEIIKKVPRSRGVLSGLRDIKRRLKGNYNIYSDGRGDPPTA